MPLHLDLNNPQFQSGLFALNKDERHAVLNTLSRLMKLEWTDLYRHSGLNWEQIHSLAGPAGQVLYSLRVTQKMRLVAWREGDTDSSKFLNIRKSTGCYSIPQSPYFLILPLVGLNRFAKRFNRSRYEVLRLLSVHSDHDSAYR